MADSTSQTKESSFSESVFLTVILIGVFALVVFVIYGSRNYDAAVIPSTTGGDSLPTAAMVEEQDAEVLGSYGWVDQEKGVVRIPVDRAQELFLQELNN